VAHASGAPATADADAAPLVADSDAAGPPVPLHVVRPDHPEVTLAPTLSPSAPENGNSQYNSESESEFLYSVLL